MDDDGTTPTGWSDGPDSTAEPSPAPLGALGLVVAVVSAVLAMTYFLSPLAYLGAAVAACLGALSLGDPRSRGAGIGALVVSALAVTCATLALVG